MKVILCTLIGEQISSKLAASRQEFNPLLDNIQSGDEKKNRGIRMITGTDRLGEVNTAVE